MVTRAAEPELPPVNRTGVCGVHVPHEADRGLTCATLSASLEDLNPPREGASDREEGLAPLPRREN